MEFLQALLLNGVQFVIMGGIAVLGVMLGAKLRKAKTEKKNEE